MKKKISIVLSVLMMASALGACGGKTTDAPAVSRNADAPGETAADSGKTPIKIAFSGPMTGDYAEYGQNFYAACEIAVDEINSSGGLLDGAPMELLQFDDKNSQEEVGAIAEMIASDDSIAAVLGHFSSGVAMTAANTYMDAGIPLLSASASHPDYSGMGEYIFRNNVLISQEVETVLQKCQNRGSKRVGVLVLKNDWGQGALQAMETAYEQVKGKVDFEIVLQEEVMDGTEEFSANITKFMEQDCDTVFVLTMYATFAPFANQYRTLNPDIKMFSVGSAYSTELINLGGSAVEGVRMCAGFNPENPDPAAQKFVQQFNEKTGHDPDNMAVQTYENVNMIAQAIERAGSAERSAIKDALYDTDYDAITGHITFNGIGDAQKNLLVFEVSGGKFVELTDMAILPWDEFVASL